MNSSKLRINLCPHAGDTDSYVEVRGEKETETYRDESIHLESVVAPNCGVGEAAVEASTRRTAFPLRVLIL